MTALIQSLTGQRYRSRGRPHSPRRRHNGTAVQPPRPRRSQSRPNHRTPRRGSVGCNRELARNATGDSQPRSRTLLATELTRATTLRTDPTPSRNTAPSSTRLKCSPTTANPAKYTPNNTTAPSPHAAAIAHTGRRPQHATPTPRTMTNAAGATTSTSPYPERLKNTSTTPATRNPPVAADKTAHRESLESRWAKPRPLSG